MPLSTDAGWSAWRRIESIPPLNPDTFAEILDGGQAFRWKQEGSAWLGFFDRIVVRLKLDEKSQVTWSAPRAIAKKAEEPLHHYLQAKTQLTDLVDQLPWRSDRHLARCLAAFPGLRILRQPFGETLLGFLCSATKQIVQIKQMVALLAARHGQALFPVAEAPPSLAAHPAFRLPSWEEIAQLSEADLRGCLLGFRAAYIHRTAKFLAQNPGWLETTENAPYLEAKERLCTLPGVGEKVADCVLLFGAGRLEAFPVDVWIIKSMAARYGLEGWKPAQIAQFGRIHFGALAGLAQQYLFAWERRHGRE